MLGMPGDHITRDNAPDLPRPRGRRRLCPGPIVLPYGNGMKGEKGESLIEVVISLLVLGIVAAAMAGFFQWSLGVFGYVDRKATAESVARSQWEYVKSQEYSDNFTYGIINVEGYSIEMKDDNTTVTSGVQRMTYKVTSPPQADGPPVTVELEGYKVDR